MGRHTTIAIAAAVLASVAPAQTVISARAGLIHHLEGEAVVSAFGEAAKARLFSNLDDGETLQTRDGRAEVLFTPGVFVRMAENSAIRMLSNGLGDAQLELLAGSILVQSNGPARDSRATFVHAGHSFEMQSAGALRFESGKLVVQRGTLRVLTGAKPVTVTEGREVSFEAGVQVNQQAAAADDDFARWSESRSREIAKTRRIVARTIARHERWLATPYAPLRR